MKVFILKTDFFRKKNMHTLFVVSSYNIYVRAGFCDQIPLRNTRFTSSFTPTMQEAMRRNPQLGNLKLVGICWDSRHIKTQHPIDFKFQRRSYSTKIHNNAIVVLSACGLDAIEKFVYLTAASVSPANTDEALASFIIDLETDYGKYYLHYYFIVSLINRPTAK